MNINTSHCNECTAKLIQLMKGIGLVLASILVGITSLMAQEKVRVFNAEGNIAFVRRLPADSSDLRLRKIMNGLKAEGFLLSKVESTSEAIEVQRGSRFSVSFIDWDMFPDQVTGALGLLGSEGRNFSWKRFQKTINDILKHAENNGSPFAQVLVDTLFRNDSNLNIRLAYNAGPLIRWDTVATNGLSRTKIKYLSRYLHVQPGELFNELQYKRINQRIDQLNYLSLNRPPTVSFVNERARVELFLAEEKVNAFDGIIGFLQNNNNERLIITGIVDLELYNLFGTGKELQLHWQQQKERSQSLELSYFHPLLFQTDIGGSFSYSQLKEDTTFINRNLLIGFQFPVGKTSVTANYKRNTGRLLGQIAESEFARGIADFNIDFYEFGFSYDWYNQARPLQRGGELAFTGSVGRKAILRNPQLPNSFYDSLSLNSNQYQFQLNGLYNLPLKGSWSVYQRLRAASVYNPALFLNDLLRLGGLKSLRGFNELQFFASAYALSNTELRWAWNETSYVFFFYDQAFYARNTINESFNDQPFGLGVGLSLTSEAGIFSLVYALGQQSGQNLNLNQAKVHFGFTSRF